MSDADQASQALAELWDIVKCRCHEAYTGRGLHDPDCQCDSTDAVQTVADRIEELETKLTKAVEALRCLEIAATGAGVHHLQERKILHEQIALTRAVLAELEK